MRSRLPQKVSGDRLGVEPCDDGDDSAVVIWDREKAELGEDAGDVASTVLSSAAMVDRPVYEKG